MHSVGDNESIDRYIKQLEEKGLSIYQVAILNLGEIKKYIDVKDDIAEKIIKEAELRAKKNIRKRLAKYQDELRMLPHVGEKRAEILRLKNLNIENIADLDVGSLISILPRIRRSDAEDIISAARIVVKIETGKKIGGEEVKREREEVVVPPPQKVEETKKVKEETEVKTEEKEVEIKALKRKLPKIRQGLVNGNGLMDVKGVVNGLYFREMKKKRVKLPILVLILLIIAVPISTYFLLVPSNSLQIDGKFGDWESIGGYAIGNMKIKFAYQDGNLYFYYKRPNLFQENESVYVAIDSGKSGYSLNGIYVNTIAGVYGWKSHTVGGGVWRHSSSLLLWNFTRSGGIHYAFGDGQLEAEIKNVREDSKIVFVDERDNGYFTSPPFSIDDSDVFVIQKSITNIITNGGSVYSIFLSSPKKFNLERMKVMVEGASILSGIIEINGGKIFGSTLQNSVEFNINKNVENAKISFSGKFTGSAGSLVKIKTYFEGKDVHFSYINETSNFYLFTPPSNVSIDGAFGDWKNIREDVIGDVSDPNIDLTNYSYTHNLSDIFFEVRGRMMGGTDIPLFYHWAPKDSDRDTVPDKYDKYPYDFNNDGIPDNESYVVVNGKKLPDVDGDGVADYPYGPDTWLNTTIPSNFPKPYAGRKVSVYIGPPPPQKPKNGNDTAELYFGNGDSKGAHLYWVPFVVDYKITITGRDGIYRAYLYRYSPGRWIFEGRIGYIASGYHRIELATGLNLSNGRFWITIFNWNNQQDSPSIVRRAGTIATTTNVFYLHADSNGNPSNMNWTMGNNLQSVTYLTGVTSSHWVYENALAEDYYISSATAYLYVDSSSNPKTNDVLNVSLVMIDSNGNQRLLMYGTMQGSSISTGAMNTISLTSVIYNKVLKGYYLLLYANYTIGTPVSSLQIDYNSSSPQDSNLTIKPSTVTNITDVWTENTTAKTQYFKDGELIKIFGNVTDPLSYHHIKNATLSIYYYNSTSHSVETLLHNVSMIVNISRSGYAYLIFQYNYSLATNAPVGRYNITITAWSKENYKTSNTSGYFKVQCNISVSPYTNSSTGTIIWYNHTIWNNGSGYDLISINVSANVTVNNISLYYKTPSGLELMAYNNSGNGWNWVNTSFDTDNDGNPDTGWLAPGESFKIVVRVNASNLPPNSQVNTTVQINDIYICSDSAKDTTTVPEFNSFTAVLIAIPLLVFFGQRKWFFLTHKHRSKHVQHEN